MANDKLTVNDKIIINRPERLPNARKGIEMTLLTIGWGLWLLFFRPVFAFVLWIIGFKFFYKYLLSDGGIAGLKENGMLFLSIALFTLAGIFAWNIYNRQLFKKASKRKNVREVRSVDLDRFFSFDIKTSNILQKAKSLNFNFKSKNRVEAYDESIQFISKGRFRPT